MDHILIEAQSRWLRPAEICEILRNYTKFHVSTEPPYMPPSGSMFIFDRKVLRCFRKDGYNWRKKKDGKTVKEAHERLKAQRVNVLDCYYAHREGNKLFQRRIYWMLEEELSHVVLVHYRHVEGTREYISRINLTNCAHSYESEKAEPLNGQMMDHNLSSSFLGSRTRSLTADSASIMSAWSSELEDDESGYNHWASSNRHSFLDLSQPGIGKNDPSPSVHLSSAPSSSSCEEFSRRSAMNLFPLALAHKAHKRFQEEKMEDNSPYINGVLSMPFTSSHQSIQADIVGKEIVTSGQLSEDVFGRSQAVFNNHSVAEDPTFSSGNGLAQNVNLPIDCNLFQSYDIRNSFVDERENVLNFGGYDLHCAVPKEQLNYTMQNDSGTQYSFGLNDVSLDSIIDPFVDGKSDFPLATEEQFFDTSSSQALSKFDCFEEWLSNEFGDGVDAHIDSSMAYCEGAESGDAQVEGYTLAPSLSKDQVFSIVDFFPTWTYEGAKVKILIRGKFLKDEDNIANREWSCMFGEVEVPAELVSDDTLRCWTPFHNVGRVPFYITSSNRIACSEVREFEYRVNPLEKVDTLILQQEANDDTPLITQLIKFLTLEPSSTPFTYETNDKVTEIISLLMFDYDELSQTTENIFKDKSSPEGKTKNVLLEMPLKLKLLKWLNLKVSEGGKGPNILDESGQGVLHLVAALGYFWAITPVLLSGVNVNFRDVKGWSALHWAAAFGREHTVASLISQGAAPGALTDPVSSYPSGRTPSDLASAKGHTGIAGYLAESALSAHFASLKRDVLKKRGGTEVSMPSNCNIAPLTDGNLSYNDSHAAVSNATQAAARIHQVFRVQPFQRKQQLRELRERSLEISKETAFSLHAAKSRRLGHHDESLHNAATCIQNKFRSSMDTKDFLKTRADHVRGRQIRTTYRDIIWVVCILEKVILRWRRKGCGLRGFRSKVLLVRSGRHCAFAKEGDFDFLKEGRKQLDKRLQKSLEMVNSMAQCPEAIDQYRRILIFVTEIHTTKVKASQSSCSCDNFKTPNKMLMS